MTEYLWWHDITDNSLWRTDLDGTNTVEFPMPAGESMRRINSVFDVSRLYLWDHLSGPTDDEVASVDITDPDSPSMVRYTGQFGGKNIYRIVPLSNLVAVADVAESAGKASMWRTTDGGANWTKTLNDQPIIPVNNIVVDYTDHDAVWLSSSFDEFGAASPYVYYSTDGGQTWASESVPLASGDYISALGLSGVSGPMQPIVGTHDGELWRRNGPSSWSQVYDGAVFIPTVHPNPSNGDDIFVMETDTGIISTNYRIVSNDGGSSWVRSENIVVGLLGQTVSFRDGTGAIYVGHDPGPVPDNLAKSTDQGATWVYLTVPGAPEVNFRACSAGPAAVAAIARSWGQVIG